MEEKGLFIFLLVLNIVCVFANIFIFKDYGYLAINVVTILCCVDTLIGIKKRGD